MTEQLQESPTTIQLQGWAELLNPSMQDWRA
jgi:hypothetical protein